MTAELPTDADLLALCRQRLHTVTEAILTYMDVVEATGKERQAAFERWADLRKDGAPHGPIYFALWNFATTFECTLPARHAAAEALHAALSEDWRTAILCDAELSDEERREWLRKGEGAPAP